MNIERVFNMVKKITASKGNSLKELALSDPLLNLEKVPNQLSVPHRIATGKYEGIRLQSVMEHDFNFVSDYVRASACVMSEAMWSTYHSSYMRHGVRAKLRDKT